MGALASTKVRVVAELAEDPGGEDRVEPGLAGVDLSVSVAAKMCAHQAAWITVGWRSGLARSIACSRVVCRRRRGGRPAAVRR